jgi:hypothetical protein
VRRCHPFEVKWLCEVVEVARWSFYAWLAAADHPARQDAAVSNIKYVGDISYLPLATAGTCIWHGDRLLLLEAGGGMGDR